MQSTDWRGVMPAITTPFTRALAVDHAFLRRHVVWLADAGCTGIVTPGSLGEGTTLSLDEKGAIWRTCIEAVGTRIAVVAAIAGAGTDEAVRTAREARSCGCAGLMVLPPYVYKGSWRETRNHLSVIITATPLSCMVYNNPIAYGTDLLPEHVAELTGAHANLHAVKESSADVRRITAIKALLGERLAIFVGVDDLVVEGVAAGASGWIAGLVNALPAESVRLFELVGAGRGEEAGALYRWFLPLLRMDTTPDFVQLIKLVQAEVGMVGEGGPAVRPPRLLPEGSELARVRAEIRGALHTRPRLVAGA